MPPSVSLIGSHPVKPCLRIPHPTVSAGPCKWGFWHLGFPEMKFNLDPKPGLHVLQVKQGSHHKPGEWNALQSADQLLSSLVVQELLFEKLLGGAASEFYLPAAKRIGITVQYVLSIISREMPSLQGSSSLPILDSIVSTRCSGESSSSPPPTVVSAALKPPLNDLCLSALELPAPQYCPNSQLDCQLPVSLSLSSSAVPSCKQPWKVQPLLLWNKF